MMPIDLEHWGPQRDFVSLKTKDGSFRPLSLPEAFSVADSEVFLPSLPFLACFSVSDLV